MKVRQLREPLLRQAAFSTQLTQPSPELGSWVVSGRHAPSLADAHFESTHDECDMLGRQPAHHQASLSDGHSVRFCERHHDWNLEAWHRAGDCVAYVEVSDSGAGAFSIP